MTKPLSAFELTAELHPGTTANVFHFKQWMCREKIIDWPDCVLQDFDMFQILNDFQ